ncbi:MAG TPA: ATP-binding protein [Candidatus Paceibacterota bacterium]|nr:ATP-binding protein [Candidatus Paceibacterota bacterium]
MTTCNFLPDPTYLFFSSEAPVLLYYSHFPAIAITLLLGLFVFLSNRTLASKLLLTISVLLSGWTLLNLIAWTNNVVENVLFVWSLFGLMYGLISVFSIYLTYVFIHKNDIPLRYKITFGLLLLPILIFTSTKFNLSGFYYDLCGASGHENVYFLTYYTTLGIISMVWIFGLLFKAIRRCDTLFKKQILLFGIGIELFLSSFFVSSFLASYLNEKGLVSDYSLEFYGLFGMVLFMAFIAFIIVRFKAFNVKLLGAQALIVALIILIGSEFLFVENTLNQVLVSITLIVTGIIGIVLIRSVKKEDLEKEKIEMLAISLKAANERLERLNQEKTEFISLATHQIRAPLSAIKGYASLILEGDYGETSDDIKDAVSTMYSSAHNLVGVVGDYLDISRIDLNRMKFNFSDVDLKQTLSEIVKEQQPNLRGKGLELLWHPDSSLAKTVISADIGKIKQVISNLIDNAIKYTPKGSITLSLANAAKLEPGTKGFRITIQDTGIGLNEQTIPKLFKRFSRADSAHEVNVHGTGLGLYLARKMVEAHSGKIWAESDGEGKGSRFIIELPVKAELRENSLADGEEEEGKV